MTRLLSQTRFTLLQQKSQKNKSKTDVAPSMVPYRSGLDMDGSLDGVRCRAPEVAKNEGKILFCESMFTKFKKINIYQNIIETL